MSTFVSLFALTLLAAPADRPDWYSGRHAVLVVVDGLGEGTFDRLRAAGHLRKTGQRFVEGGRRDLAAIGHWPGRGADEARGVARGQRGSLGDDQAYAPPGVEGWPQGSFAAFGAEQGNGLAALLKALPRPGKEARPPVLAVAHERGFAAAVAEHGAQSVQAGRALSALDDRLDALFEVYRALGLAEDTLVALVSPAGLPATSRRLQSEALFRDLRRRKNDGSARLASLLSTFEPVEILTRGSIALLTRRTQSAAPSVEETTFKALLTGAGVPARRGAAMLDQLARKEGVALVVAREAGAQADVESLLVVGRGGRARLEWRAPAQLRYGVLSGPDPLQLGGVPASLGAKRFHAEAVWHIATADRPLADAPTRVAHLLELSDGAALAVVAKPGFTFDQASPGVAADARALSLWCGAGLSGEEGEPTRTLDVAPTLLTWLGASLDERLEGRPRDELLEAGTVPTVRAMSQAMVARATDAFTRERVHDASVIDTTDVRRFGTPPKYFAVLRAGMAKEDPLSYLPEESIQRQIGPRRSLLIVATAVSVRVERLVLKHAPNEIRRFDPLIRPEFMLAGFLEDPVMRARLKILEGPRQRVLKRAAASQ